jgi:hypothetical protein
MSDHVLVPEILSLKNERASVSFFALKCIAKLSAKESSYICRDKAIKLITDLHSLHLRQDNKNG